MKTLPAFVFLFLSLLACVSSACAEDYQGADAVLKQMDAQSGGDASPKSNPVLQWRDDLKNYQTRAATLAPDEAAKTWLDLFDRALKLPISALEQRNGGSTSPRLMEMFRVLPPPADWDALATQAKARPQPEKGSADFSTTVLRVITATLQNKPDDVRHAIELLKQQADNVEGSQQGNYFQQVSGLQEAFLTLSGDQKGTLASFEAKLALLKPGGDSLLSESERQMQRMNVVKVPDLITLAGEARAKDLLKQVFAVEAGGIDIGDDRTKALARKVALEMGSRLKFAPWSLTDTLDSTALYELLDKHFSGKPGEYYERRQADAYYLFGLIAQRRYDEATAMAVKMGRNAASEQTDTFGILPDQALNDLAGKGYADEVYQFFDRLLASHPALPYWHSYTDAAVLAGKTDAMLARVKATSERADLKPRVKSGLRTAYGDALLAADRVAEALPILREQAASMFRAASASGAANDAMGEAVRAAARLVGLGRLLGDDALINEQLDIIAKAAQALPKAISGVSSPTGENIGEDFLAAKRGPKMERMLTANLLQGEREGTVSLAQGAMVYTDMSEVGSRYTREPLSLLVDLYYRAGRYEDIMTLLDHAKDWGAEDITGLLSLQNTCSRTEFPCQVARAMQKTGHADAALRVVNAYLENNGGGSDPAYELLLELLPPDKAEARLNVLFQGDQFEERPLIWRAFVQLGQNRLDEAEKSARQAISIDPSDGEEGRGDRMRAYAVLGDILERKGDTEKAGQMRQAVQAIRLSEDADNFHAAGLLTRAVGMYEKALGYFSDAYCIQSRLAIQLTALGKPDEAMTHYERAYELMPESFGRMESHCFGCERAFAGERAQSRAEQVFQKLVAAQPDNARVHYLLGYLRMEQERKTEAAHEFRAAVRLDPDYINAWKQLAATTDDPSDRNHAELNLLRLDPRRKHDSADLTAVSDLKALWSAVEEAAKLTPPEPSNLYPLAASKEYLEQERQRHPKQTEGSANPGGLDGALLAVMRGDSSERFTPWAVVMQNIVVAHALQLLPRNDAEM